MAVIFVKSRGKIYFSTVTRPNMVMLCDFADCSSEGAATLTSYPALNNFK